MVPAGPPPSPPPAPGSLLDAAGMAECLQQAPDGIVVLDQDGKVCLYNHHAERLCGLPAAQVLGEPVACLLTAGEYEQLIAGLHGEAPEPLLLPASAHPGRSSSVSLSFTVAHAHGGRLYVGIARDVGAQLEQQQHMRELSQALDGSDNAILLCDRDARIRYVNEGFARLFGYSAEEAIGKQPSDLIRGPHTDPATLAYLGEQHLAGHAHRSDLLGYRRDGSPVWLSVVVTPLVGAGRSLINVFTDITIAKTHEVLNGKVLDALVRDEPLEDTMELACREIERVAPDLLATVARNDADGHLLPLAAPGLPPSLAVSPACLLAARRGRPVEIEDITTDPACANWHEQALEQGVRASWSQPVRSTAGHILGALTFHCRQPGLPSRWHRRLAELCLRLCALAMEREQARSRMHRLAFYDVLTGLPNRVMFNALCEQPLQMAEQHPMPMALLFVALDRFARINESQGHAAGDGLLRDLARRLQELAGAEAVVGRQHGDEFVLLVPRCGQHQAALLCEELLASITAPRAVGNLTVHAGASIGVAIHPEDGRTAESLLQHANLAMRRAKEEGGGRFRFFSTDMNRLAQERLLLEAALREALQRGQLRLHYQPQVCADGSGLYGAEALLRWRHPHLGDIAPARFLPLAEECGLMAELSQWVLDEACRQQALWRAAGIGVPRVAVNLSASAFEQPSLVEQVQRALELHHLDPGMLVLEITESVMLSEQPRVLENMHALHALGVPLSLDDFGTGYSSLSHLHRLPISELKLDRSFVGEIGHSQTALALVISVLRIGESLHKHVVAEGVETEAQRALLVEQGCHILQGYLYAPALPAEALEQWLRERVDVQQRLL